MGKRKKTSQKLRLDAASIQWCEESVPAAQFLQSHTLPQVVKLNSGEYGNFGCGTEVDVTQAFLLHTARNCTKVRVIRDNSRGHR